MKIYSYNHINAKGKLSLCMYHAQSFLNNGVRVSDYPNSLVSYIKISELFVSCPDMGSKLCCKPSLIEFLEHFIFQ